MTPANSQDGPCTTNGSEGGDFFASSPPAAAPITTAPPSSSAPRTMPSSPTSSRPKRSSVSRSRSPSKPNGSSLFIGGSSDSEDEAGDAIVVDDDHDPTWTEASTSNGKKRSAASPSSGRKSVQAAQSSPHRTRTKRSRSVQSFIDADADEEDEIEREPSQPQWDRRYIGNFCIAGWALSKGRGYIEEGVKVIIQRQKPKALATQQNSPAKPPPKKQTKLSFGKAASKPSGTSNASGKSKQQEDSIVRFSNMRGFEVGRLPGEVAVWVSKLIDLDIAEFEANVVACPPVLSVGCDILLDVKAYLKRTAFPAAQDVRRSRNTRNEPTKNFFEETAETANEKELRQRKSSLIRMFKACDLRPTQANDILRQHTEEGHFGGSSMLDHFGGKEALRSSHSPPPPRKPNANANGTSTQTAIAIDSAGPSSPKTDEAPNDGGDEGQDVNDGTEMEADQMSAVYSKAQKHDVDLPEEEPPDTFALTLRPYQKQALGWMKNMEKPASLRQGREGQRTEASLHPLWQEYAFPADPNDNQEADDLGSFYFNPYIGEMSLEFQPASQGTRGGILADEMGLGKTIMVASLLHANRAPKNEEGQDEDEEDERARQADKKGPRQTSLASAFNSSSRDKRKPSAGQATLVVAPMSLVGQWVSELEKASNPNTLSAMLYYAEGKADLVGRLEGGSVDVIVTSYGVLVSEYKRFCDAGGPAASASKVARVAPLYAVDWLRVILDEAHSIRNRTTRNARACHDLMARRRWCLTGSPIVNRLTDLYSLLNFLRVEPWGDFAFFNSFIGKPFANKNPKALEIVQVVLESILLRREKKFKDKDGKPIVNLPSKTMDIQHLDFSETEREVYELCYKRAWIQYQRLRNDGTMGKNLSVIFSVLMKLRQAVCHPLLVLQAMQASHARAKEGGAESNDVGTMDEATEEQIKELVARYQAGQADADADGVETAQELSEETAASLDPAQLLDGQDDEECPLCHDVKSDPACMPCAHSACRSCLIDEMQACEDRGESTQCAVCREGPFTVEQLQSNPKTLHSADAVRANSNDTRLHSLAKKQELRSCTKLDALISDLSRLRTEDPSLKGVIFSQFTSFLDLVEVVLKRHHHPFLRLDGTTPQKDRESILRTFASTPNHMLILVSLRAGGVGLNLTSANHCWLLDVWWAGQIEDQCIDRIHRIGQERDVFVHRYLIKDSIEDRILLIQNRKRVLVNQALGGGGGGAGSRGEDVDEGEMAENLKILFGD